MKEPFRTSLVVREPGAAAVFAQPLDLRYLSPFIGQARLVSSVARELEVPLTTLAYRVKKLLALGLLEVDRVEQRKGSPLTYYRAAADAFFVPFEATDAETLDALLARWEEPWASLFHRSYARALDETGGRWGVQVWRDETGEVRVAPRPQLEPAWNPSAESAPALLDELVLGLRLDNEDAKQLQRDLLHLLQRYSSRQGAQPYFLRLVLTPTTGNKVLR